MEDAFPEIGAGGFSRIDGTVAFYTRVNALLASAMTVVDYGAGRGAAQDDPVVYRRELATLRGKVRSVIGVDVDPVVRTNPMVDEAHVIAPGARLPFDDASVDMIVSDWVFEHLDDPGPVTGEFDRILRDGGWICARTPNRWAYFAIANRVLPRSVRMSALGWAQPRRRHCDVFPAHYALNTRRALEKYFPPSRFEHHGYTWDTGPAYFGTSPLVFSLIRSLGAVLPPPLRPMLFVYLKKRTA